MPTRRMTPARLSLVLLVTAADGWGFAIYGDSECETALIIYIFCYFILTGSTGWSLMASGWQLKKRLLQGGRDLYIPPNSMISTASN